jgi:trigger factor
MQVTETVSDGLKREFKVVVPASRSGHQGDARLGQLKDQVRINGFRPGKVPVAHLKRLYGRSVMAEMIEAAVREPTPRSSPSAASSSCASRRSRCRPSRARSSR